MRRQRTTRLFRSLPLPCTALHGSNSSYCGPGIQRSIPRSRAEHSVTQTAYRSILPSMRQYGWCLRPGAVLHLACPNSLTNGPSRTGTCREAWPSRMLDEHTSQAHEAS